MTGDELTLTPSRGTHVLLLGIAALFVAIAIMVLNRKKAEYGGHA